MATSTPDVRPSIRTLPLPEESMPLFSRAVRLVLDHPEEFMSVGKWLDKHYSEAALRARCERKYRQDFAYRLRLLRRDSHTYNRRLALQHGCPVERVNQERISEALMRGQRLEGTKLVGKSHPVDTVVDESNVHLVFAWEDEQYRRHFREIKAERKAAKLSEYEHPEKPGWRLARAVGEIIEAEYPDPPEHVEHSRRIVGMAALLVSADTLPRLGELGRWEWESKPDTTWESDPENPNDDFWRDLSRPPAQDGPHKTPLHLLHARYEGREEVLFHRMPGESRELQHQWGGLSSFHKLLRIAVDELETQMPSVDVDQTPHANVLINQLNNFGKLDMSKDKHEQTTEIKESNLAGAVVNLGDGAKQTANTKVQLPPGLGDTLWKWLKRLVGLFRK